MSDADALAYAVNLLGPKAIIHREQEFSHSDGVTLRIERFTVGRSRPEKSAIDVLGRGADWREALLDAESRVKAGA